MRWSLLEAATVFFLPEHVALGRGVESMWRKLARGYRQFARDAPGQRFVDAYERWKGASRNPITSLILLMIALVLIAVGALLALVPGVPGIVLGVLGLGLIAIRFRRVAIWLDWSEMKGRGIWRRFRRRNVFR